MTARPFVPLLVSADRALLRQLSKFLEVFGFDLKQATDAVQALRLAEASPIDFLIVDAECEPRATAQLCRAVRKLTPESYIYALLLAQERDVATLTESLEAGFDDFLMQPVVYGELLARLRAGSRVIEFERRCLQQAGIDSATQLPDELSLCGRLQQRLEAADAGSAALAVLDVDAFRRIHRLHGETAAALHQQIAKQLRELCAAASDTPPLLAVLHANRFALLWNQAPFADAAEQAKSISTKFAEHEFTFAGQTIRFTMSVGITALESGEQAEQTQQRALRALALAKSSGRSVVVTSDEVEQELEAWTESAAAGRLFESTLARDVMLPCPLMLGADETLEQAFALLTASQLEFAPAIETDGRLIGLVRRDEIDRKRSRSSKLRGSSVRLLRHIAINDVPTFEETASLGVLMEFFTEDGRELALVVRDKRPLGIVTCQGLAALNERLAADRFVPCGTARSDSQYLIVPDLPLLDAEVG